MRNGTRLLLSAELFTS